MYLVFRQRAAGEFDRVMVAQHVMEAFGMLDKCVSGYLTGPDILMVKNIYDERASR